VPMTEAEWLAETDPQKMLEYLRGKASERKLRLFVADGVRSLVSIFGQDQEVLAEMHERVAEGRASLEDLERFLLRDMPELWEHRAPGGNLSSAWDTARMVVRDRFKLAPLEKCDVVTEESRAAEYAEMCRVLRCIFGNPFRPPPPIDPSWLRWNDGTVSRVAQGIYDERAFDRMGILADALLDAGCDNEDVLGHCRQQEAVHVRGCWVVDLLLNKE
jgi:hypothetical protein